MEILNHYYFKGKICCINHFCDADSMTEEQFDKFQKKSNDNYDDDDYFKICLIKK